MKGGDYVWNLLEQVIGFNLSVSGIVTVKPVVWFTIVNGDNS